MKTKHMTMLFVATLAGSVGLMEWKNSILPAAQDVGSSSPTLNPSVDEPLTPTIELPISSQHELAINKLTGSTDLIKFDAGQLTIHVTRYPLMSLLGELEQLTGVHFYPDPGIYSDSISLQIDALPIERLTQSLFKNYQQVALYQTGQLSAIGLFPADSSEVLTDQLFHSAASDNQLATNPVIEHKQRLMHTADSEKSLAFSEGINSPDQDIRSMTLITAQRMGYSPQPQQLKQLIFSDPDSTVRAIALSVFLGSEHILEQDKLKTAQGLSSDDALEIREQAAHFLSSLESESFNDTQQYPDS